MSKDDSFYKRLLDNISEGVYFVNPDRQIVYWNKGAEQISGFCTEQVLGRSCYDDILCHVDEEGESLCQTRCPLAKTLADGETREADVFLHNKAGYRVPVTVKIAPIRNEEGEITGAVEIFRDISGQIAERELLQSFKRAASIDELTELPNRRYIELRLHNAFEELRRHDIPFGVIFADIDHFKLINDTYGHPVGDEILAMVAKTLAGNVRTYDLVGRWGGEEFILIVPHITRENMKKLANKLRQLVEQSYITIGGETIRVTVTMGGTMARIDETAHSLIERADRLLYEGKAAGRNRTVIEDFSAGVSEAL